MKLQFRHQAFQADAARAVCEGKVKHIYFVAETKGDMSSMELRKIEEAKAHCAREHFRAISGDNNFVRRDLMRIRPRNRGDSHGVSFVP
jgi:restriction endonuclease